jgi:hypothetical protein
MGLMVMAVGMQGIVIIAVPTIVIEAFATMFASNGGEDGKWNNKIYRRLK